MSNELRPATPADWSTFRDGACRIDYVPEPDELTWTSTTLNQALEMLAAEFILAGGKLLSKTTVRELMDWSQARVKTEKGT